MHQKVLFLIISRVVPTFTDPAQKMEFKQNQKRHSEIAQNFTSNLLSNVVDIHERDSEVQKGCEEGLMNSISEALHKDDIII